MTARRQPLPHRNFCRIISRRLICRSISILWNCLCFMPDVSVNGRLRQIANNYGSERSSLEKKEFINTNSSISLLLGRDLIQGMYMCTHVYTLWQINISVRYLVGNSLFFFKACIWYLMFSAQSWYVVIQNTKITQSHFILMQITSKSVRCLILLNKFALDILSSTLA